MTFDVAPIVVVIAGTAAGWFQFHTPDGAVWTGIWTLVGVITMSRPQYRRGGRARLHGPTVPRRLRLVRDDNDSAS